MLALHECFLSSQLQRDGILPTWPLVAAHHSPNIALGFRESSKQAPTKKQNKATLSDIQQIKTMSFLRKLDHSKKKKIPRPFLQKKNPTQVSSFDNTFCRDESSTPRSDSLNGEFQPGWGARHSSQAHGAEAILDATDVFVGFPLQKPESSVWNFGQKKNLRVAKTRPFWGLKFDTQTEGLGTYPST